VAIFWRACSSLISWETPSNEEAGHRLATSACAALMAQARPLQTEPPAVVVSGFVGSEEQYRATSESPYAWGSSAGATTARICLAGDA
jgi:hypothetical protein